MDNMMNYGSKELRIKITQNSHSTSCFFCFFCYPHSNMFFKKIILICISALLIFSVNESFAASGSSITITGSLLTNSGTRITTPSSITIRDKKKTIKDDKMDEKEEGDIVSRDTDEKKIENRKIETNTQKIILEVYKIQGNKILKDMDASLEKVNPDPQVRIEFYTSIQKTLELRKIKTNTLDLSNDSKDILM